MPTTANNETLERIKREVAKEQNLRFAEFNHHAGLWLDEICERYARAVALASLKEAAENATILNTYRNINGIESTSASIIKESITDEKNIKLL